MIFVILFSCLSRGPDDQGLSRPRVTINREGLSDGGSERQDGREKEDKIFGEALRDARREVEGLLR
jgi:hypothetical protein